MEDLSKIKSYYDKSYGNRQIELYNYYTGASLPIMSRQPISQQKATSHTNLHTDFIGDIVGLKVGYLGGSIKATTLNETAIEYLKSFTMLNDLEILNSESVRDSAISGVSHRLIYTKDGEVKLKNIPGWQVVYDYIDSPLDPVKAYYYYETVSLEGVLTKHCDVYDSVNVTYYEGNKGTKSPTINSKVNQNDTSSYAQVGDPQPHNFTEVPIFPFLNNDFMFSNCEKSLSLMNVYDEVLSDISSEIKSLRNAYLKIYGELYTGLDSAGNPIDINQWLTQTGTMRFPTDDDGKATGGAEFLEKNINDTVIENNLDRLRKSIYETSGSIDLQEISKAERIFSIRASMMRLENDCMTTERYIRSALTKMMRLWAQITSAYNNVTIADYDVQWVFKRTFPRDIASEAQIISSLSPVIGLKAVLKELGWEDVEAIVEEVNATTNDLGIV